MNTQTIRRRPAHPPDSRPIPARTRRLHLLDRVALRLGVALIRWGRRSARVPADRLDAGLRHREHAAARAELARARAGAANPLGRVR